MRWLFTFVLQDDTDVGDHQLIARRVFLGPSIGEIGLRARVVDVGGKARRCLHHHRTIPCQLLLAIIIDDTNVDQRWLIAAPFVTKMHARRSKRAMIEVGLIAARGEFDALVAGWNGLIVASVDDGDVCYRI